MFKQYFTSENGLFKRFANTPDRVYPRPFFDRNNQLAQDHISRIFINSAFFLLGITLILISAYAMDYRLLDGAPIWAKPIKFSLSLILHFLTLAILCQQLKPQQRTGKTFTLFGYLAVASMIFEQLYISIQAARGRHSHFNGNTEFEGLMYQLMGLGAFNLVLISFILGIMIWRYGDKNNSGLRYGSISGLLIGSALTLYYAMLMTLPSVQSHYVGNLINNSTIPLLGWSREVGDLRLPHFIATHMMQALPLLGLLADKLKLSPRIVLLCATVILVIMSKLALDLALAGQPIFPT